MVAPKNAEIVNTNTHCNGQVGKPVPKCYTILDFAEARDGDNGSYAKLQ